MYDVTRFKDLHPGGASIFLEDDVRECFLYLYPRARSHCCDAVGKDVTDTFYGLHRHEVLLKPQYARLQVGTIKGESSQINARSAGELSDVPYAEPTWLSQGYFSPYFKEVSIP